MIQIGSSTYKGFLSIDDTNGAFTVKSKSRESREKRNLEGEERLDNRKAGSKAVPRSKEAKEATREWVMHVGKTDSGANCTCGDGSTRMTAVQADY